MNDDTPTADSTKSEIMPERTYAPVAMSLGVMLLVWGIMTHWTMSLGGGLLLAWALWNWLTQICRQWKMQDEQ